MKKITRNIMILILIILLLAIGVIFFYNQSTYKTRLAKNWDNIKGDFEIINDSVIDFSQKNNVNTINVYEFKKTLNKEQLDVFERAENNYQKYGDYGGKITNVDIKDEIIEYYDWERYGQFEKIVYTKHTKRELEKIYNKEGRHFYIEELGNNWYYLDEHHL